VRFCTICNEEIVGRKNKYCSKHEVYHENGKIPKQKKCLICSINTTGTNFRKFCEKCSFETLKDKSGHYQAFAKQIKEQWKEEGRTCVWCKSENITIDHITPLTKGGLLMDIKNLQPLCSICNTSKGNKLPPYDCHRYIKYTQNPPQTQK